MSDSLKGKNLKKRLATLAGVVAMLAGAAGISSPAHAVYPSEACNDGGGAGEIVEVPILTGSQPVTLAFEVGNSSPVVGPFVDICVANVPENQVEGTPHSVGSYVKVGTHVYEPPNGVGESGVVEVISDPDAGVNLNTAVVYAVAPTATLTGNTLTVTIPATVCQAVCDTATLTATLAITPGPAGTTGAGASLTGVSLLLDGTPLATAPPVAAAAGVGNVLGAVSAPASTLCVLSSVCVPAYVQTNGTTVAAVTVGTTTIPVNIPAACLATVTKPCGT